VKAVLDALGLKRPVLVGWSYAGRIIEDYLETYGTARIAGINYVCARTNNQPEFVGPGHEHFPAMLGADPVAERAATLAFVRACFAQQPSPELLDRILDYNMLVPPHVRAAHLARPPSDGAILTTIDVPVLVSQGDEDLLVLNGLGELTASRIPGAQLSMYRGIGHSPFVEDPARFNRELAEFAITAHAHRR
jgi:non-heme chloroperoxidase